MNIANIIHVILATFSFRTENGKDWFSNIFCCPAEGRNKKMTNRDQISGNQSFKPNEKQIASTSQMSSNAIMGCRAQGCQMAFFHTKNTSLGTFWRALKKKMFVYFMAIWNSFRQFGIFYRHLLFLVFWYTFARLGNLYQEKSGNPGRARDLLSASNCLQHWRKPSLGSYTAVPFLSCVNNEHWSQCFLLHFLLLLSIVFCIFYSI
jgi:hypothetical protein